MSDSNRVIARRRRHALQIDCPVCPRLKDRPCYVENGQGFHDERAEAAYKARELARANEG
jgi:hypothetical protein